jgi:class 3 adenylate cyclase
LEEPIPAKSMSQTSTVREVIVLVSDVCSSTSILLDLQASDSIHCWRDFIEEISNRVKPHLKKVAGENYKFLGDGFIDFLSTDTSCSSFVELIRGYLSSFYAAFDMHLKNTLTKKSLASGLTFGAEVGTISSVFFMGSPEWVGRPLNMACRLRGAIKLPPPGQDQLGHSYLNQVLLSPKLAAKLGPAAIPDKVQIDMVKRKLGGFENSEELDLSKLSMLRPYA